MDLVSSDERVHEDIDLRVSLPDTLGSENPTNPLWSFKEDH